MEEMQINSQDEERKQLREKEEYTIKKLKDYTRFLRRHDYLTGNGPFPLGLVGEYLREEKLNNMKSPQK
jgi:hypothetical protein